MQEQALEPDLLAQALVDVRIAILVVARDRMADVLRVHADLVGAAGLDAHLAVRMPAAPLQRAEMAQRRLAAIVDLPVALAALAHAHVQRDRKCVVSGKSGYAPVELGGGRFIKQKKINNGN